ncbi:MAG TPA: hypothetical protein VKB88_46905 [Bryobacteraceae bacterium]|nr:hypothetical protein [Bryobacteraceae bacterium]
MPLLIPMCLIAGLVCRAQEANPSTTPPGPADPDATATVQPAQPVQPYRNTRRFVDSVKRLFSVEAVTSTLPAAALEQMHDWPGEWGEHGSGFAKRVGSLYAQFVIGVAIEDSVKALDHEDTHFTRMGHGNFFRRTAHVVTSTVLAHKPDGSRMVAWSLPANAYGSWAIATLWSPREYRNAASIAEWGTAGMGATAGLNLFREFWPDLKSLFRRK